MGVIRISVKVIIFFVFVQLSSNAICQIDGPNQEKQSPERALYKDACSTNSVESYQKYLLSYPNGIYVQDVERRIREARELEERALYERGCRTGNIDDLKLYINKYPNGIWRTDVKSRIADHEDWDRAKRRGTKDAYERYVSQSQYKYFEKEAIAAIVDIEITEKWYKLREKTSTTIDDIADFISRYPHASCVADARKLHHELIGVQMYNNKQYYSALQEFKNAGGRSSLQSENIAKYDECEEYCEYYALSSSSSSWKLKTFLEKYPHSEHYDQVSNWYALSLSNNFNRYSGQEDYDLAKSAAKDKETHKIVLRNINDNKKTVRQNERIARKKAARYYGRPVQFGLVFTDASFGGCIKYDIGGVLKFGNYRSPVQFEIGAALLGLSYDDYNDLDFYISANSKLKVNLFSTKYGKFYIAGIGAYSYPLGGSSGGGVGIAWSHLDWTLFYYEYYFKHGYNNFGMTLTWYFSDGN